MNEWEGIEAFGAKMGVSVPAVAERDQIDCRQDKGDEPTLACDPCPSWVEFDVKHARAG